MIPPRSAVRLFTPLNELTAHIVLVIYLTMMTVSSWNLELPTTMILILILQMSLAKTARAIRVSAKVQNLGENTAVEQKAPDGNHYP